MKRILVVDDNKFNCAVVKQTLATLYEVVVTRSGNEALDSLKKEKVDLILMDIEMPQMDGHRLTKLCKSDDTIKKIPLVIFSSLVNEEMKRKGEQLGADAQLTKPEIGMLVEAIDKLISSSSAK